MDSHQQAMKLVGVANVPRDIIETLTTQGSDSVATLEILSSSGAADEKAVVWCNQLCWEGPVKAADNPCVLSTTSQLGTTSIIPKFVKSRKTGKTTALQKKGGGPKTATPAASSGGGLLMAQAEDPLAFLDHDEDEEEPQAKKSRQEEEEHHQEQEDIPAVSRRDTAAPPQNLNSLEAFGVYDDWAVAELKVITEGLRATLQRYAFSTDNSDLKCETIATMSAYREQARRYNTLRREYEAIHHRLIQHEELVEQCRVWRTSEMARDHRSINCVREMDEWIARNNPLAEELLKVHNQLERHLSTTALQLADFVGLCGSRIISVVN